MQYISKEIKTMRGYSMLIKKLKLLSNSCNLSLMSKKSTT